MTYQSMKEGAIEVGIDYGDALRLGFKNTRTTRARGYVSRTINVLTLPVMVSKSGRFFVDYPACDSTNYCLRLHLEAAQCTNGKDLVDLCKTKSDEHNIPIQQVVKRVFGTYRTEREVRK